MLNEEALVLLGTLIAAGLLVLGVVNLLWPSTPRNVRRAAPVAPRADRTPAAAAVPSRVEVAAAPVEVLPPERWEPEPVVVEDAPGPAPGQDPPPGMAAPPVKGADDQDPAQVLERCRALAREERFGEVVAMATATLGEPGRADRSTAALLWQEVARARSALGDQDAALAAFRNAVDTAPDPARAGVRTAFAAWAAETARATVAAAEEGTRFEALRVARTLLQEALASAGSDAAITAALAELEPEYWPAYEAHVQGLIAERDFGEAYRFATEALADSELPAERRGAFEAVRAETLAARIVSLIDRAAVAMEEHREWEAVGALERAETLFRSATTLSAELKQDAARRLADGYAALGRRRVESGEFEEAVDPLFRALRIGTASAENRDETRWAMVQAIQGVVDARVTMIREVAASGAQDSAVVQAEKLWTLLRTGIAAGVPQESMTAALATTRQLIEDLGGSR